MKASMQKVGSEKHVDLVPLTLLRAGESGRVGEVIGAGDMVHRIREMGLYKGAQVQMIRPGSPCIIRLHGQRLGVRVDDVAKVLVHVAAAAS
jgi:ferrous iron transport protein A